MNGNEFKAWREGFGLTQLRLADRVRVSRTTVQSWENLRDADIPQAALNIKQIWDRRLRQEMPERGPVTLVYADAPMFIDPFRPRHRPAMMIQEPHPNNAAVLARVQQLSGRVDFHSPFVLESDRQDLWNTVELDRVLSGDDENAPTLHNLLRMIAEDARASTRFYVGDTPALPTQQQRQVRDLQINALAGRLERIAQDELALICKKHLTLDDMFRELLSLGAMAPTRLVSAVHFALVTLEKNPMQQEGPKMVSAGNYVIDYRGYEITYQSPPMFPNRWVVNLSSVSPHLMNRLGRGNIIIEDITLEAAVSKAKRHVDGLT